MVVRTTGRRIESRGLPFCQHPRRKIENVKMIYHVFKVTVLRRLKNFLRGSTTVKKMAASICVSVRVCRIIKEFKIIRKNK